MRGTSTNAVAVESTNAVAVESTNAVAVGSVGGLTTTDGGDLCRSSAADLRAARSHRDALVAAATVLVAACGHDPDVGTCADAGCGLDTHGPIGSAVCATAHRLARLPDAPPVLAAIALPTAVSGFHAALDGAADAIRACRQTAHAGEGCWFSAAPGVDGCGEVLRLLHRCG